MKKIAIYIFVLSLIAILPLACNKSSNQGGTATTAGEDSRITAAVKDKIITDNELSNAKIDVDTDNAIVSLKGEVPSKMQEDTAIRLAQSVNGVRSVRSFLKIEAEEGGAGGTGYEDSKTGKVKEELSDASITTKVKLEFAKDKEVDASDIHVETNNGTVTLSGTVSSKLEADRAIELAGSIDGVKHVISNLEVKPASGGPGYENSKTGKVKEELGDVGITTKVKLEFAKDKDVSAFDIHVETNNGTVTLDGTVDSKAKADRAIELVRSIDGVRHVISNLVVKPRS